MGVHDPYLIEVDDPVIGKSPVYTAGHAPECTQLRLVTGLGVGSARQSLSLLRVRQWRLPTIPFTGSLYGEDPSRSFLYPPAMIPKKTEVLLIVLAGSPRFRDPHRSAFDNPAKSTYLQGTAAPDRVAVYTP